jgi:hypothetical protein
MRNADRPRLRSCEAGRGGLRGESEDCSATNLSAFRAAARGCAVERAINVDEARVLACALVAAAEAVESRFRVGRVYAENGSAVSMFMATSITATIKRSAV